MKKKLLSVLLVFVMALTLLPTGAFALVFDNSIDPDRVDFVGDDDDDWPNYFGEYSIRYSVDNLDHGDVIGPDSAIAGKRVSFDPLPEDGYRYAGATAYYDGTLHSIGTTFTMPEDDVIIYISFERVSNAGDYDLDYDITPSRGGSVTFYDRDNNAISSADEGEKVYMYISTATGYSVKSVWSSEEGDYIYDWRDGYEIYSYSFTMPDEDVYFDIELESGEYSIRTDVHSYYGSVELPYDMDSANKGDTVSFTVEPARGYIVESVSVYSDDGFSRSVSVTRDEDDWNTFYFTMPGYDVVIEPSFTDDYHEITLDYGKGGKATVEAEPAGYFNYIYYGIDGERVYIDVTADKGYEVKSVTVTDDDGDRVSVRESTKDGQYYFTMPTSDVTVSVQFSYRILSNPFTDVKSSDWYYDAVSYVYSMGIMDGTSVYLFSPNSTTSRGMLVTILWRLEGEPSVSGSSFSDVKSSAYYYDAVRWAAKYGIVEGYDGNLFKPDEAITREQFAAILYRYAQHCKYSTSATTSLLGYADSSKISGWAAAAMKWAVAEDLFDGDENGRLDPQGQTTRAAAAKLLMAFCENVVS